MAFPGLCFDSWSQSLYDCQVWVTSSLTYDSSKPPLHTSCILASWIDSWVSGKVLILTACSANRSDAHFFFFFFFFGWGLLHGPQQGPDRMKEKPIRLGKGKLLPKQKNPPWKTSLRNWPTLYWFRCINLKQFTLFKHPLLKKVVWADLLLIRFWTRSKIFLRLSNFLDAKRSRESINLKQFELTLREHIIGGWRELDNLTPHDNHHSSRIMRIYHTFWCTLRNCSWLVGWQK